MKALYQNKSHFRYLWILLTICQLGWSQPNRALIKDYKTAKQNASNKFVNFNINNRKALYQGMDVLPRLIWGKLKGKYLIYHKCAIKNQDYYIVFYDYDNDRTADQFVLQTMDRKELRDDFGFIYDLNNDGKIDYIIYNGGSMITNDDPFFHYFYHWIDTNYDGQIDALAYNYVIYDEDTRPDPSKIFWIIDLDHDGKPDRVDSVDGATGNTSEIKSSGGIWDYKTLFGPKQINPNDENYFKMYSEFLNAVNSD